MMSGCSAKELKRCAEANARDSSFGRSVVRSIGPRPGA